MEASAVVYAGDSLAEIKKLPDNKFHLLYTNPPFGITGV
jgi:DNA modification methylase